MYACPHCTRETVSFSRKWLSSPILPAACRACGGLSFAPGSRGNVLLVIGAVLFTAAGFLSVHWKSPSPLVGAAALAFALWVVRLHLQPLLRITTDQVVQSSKAEGIGWFTVLLLEVMQ